MEKQGGVITCEAGDEMFVVIANHISSSRRASTISAVVGTFTELRLAESAASAYGNDYGKNGEVSYGPVVSANIFSTCLDQHGTCPLVGTWTPPKTPDAPIEESPLFVPGPYLRDVLESASPYAIFKGLVDEALSPELDKVYWETFGVDHETETACERTGLEVLAEEPELENDAYADMIVEPHDDVDAALAYLRKGGALCKVHDSEGSPYYRFLVVATPGHEEIRGRLIEDDEESGGPGKPGGS